MALTINGTTGIETNTDTGEIKIGESDDLRLYHSGSHSYIQDQGTGNLYVLSNQFEVLNAAGNEAQLRCTQDGGTLLFHNNVARLETTGSGVSITGDLSVSGSSPGGIGYISQWSHGGFAANADTNGDLTSSWSEFNQSNMGHTLWSLLGTSMTESSGIFKFPVKGHWMISYSLAGYHDDTASRIAGNRIYLSTNGGSSWTQVAHGQWNTWDASGVDNGVAYGQCYCSVVLDVTSDVNDTTPFQVKFYYQTEGAMQVSGGNTGNNVTFIKLADT